MADAGPVLKRELRFWDLVFFNIAAVASIRWIGAAAHAGPGTISLWVIAILAFFVPSALVVASLTARFPEEGGLYIWTKRAYGDWHGFLCGWLYFASNLLFVPSLALMGVAISGYIWSANPERVSEDRVYTLTVTLILIWVAYMAHLVGLAVGKWTGNVGGAATYTAIVTLVIAATWIALHGSVVTHFNLTPAPTWDSLNLWSQIAFALVGLELGPILGGEIIDPRRNVPRAAWTSAAGCALFYIAGTAAILVLRPPADVSQVTGIVQAAQTAGTKLGIPLFGPLFASLCVIGTIGALSSWIAGNSRLPMVIGLDHYLPDVFAKLHPKYGTPYVSIWSQAALSTLFLLATQAGETITAAYQILLDMTIIVGLLPYVYIFAVGWKFRQKLASSLGLAISVAAILLSLVPPPEVSSVAIFELKVIGGCVLLAVLGRMIFMREKVLHKKSVAA